MRYSSLFTQVVLASLLLVIGLVAPMRGAGAAGQWAPGTEPKVHVVAAGETLSTIAPREWRHRGGNRGGKRFEERRSD